MTLNPPHLTLRGYEGHDYMGDTFKKTNDYAQTWFVPLMRGQSIDNRQIPGDDCGFFEDQSVRCFTAFGAKLGRLYCDLEHRDLQECVSRTKKNKRFWKIRDVRFKKWLRGETPHIFEPLADYLKSVHGAPTSYPTGHRVKK